MPDAVAIVPRPTRIETREGEVYLPATIRVSVDEALHGARPLVLDLFSRRLGLAVVNACGDEREVALRLVADLPDGAYRLEVSDSPTAVAVEAGGTEGALNALRTLAQLVGPDAFRAAPIRVPGPLPCVRVEDAPRYGYRGVLLDVARHFMPKEAVMRFIELAAAHKLNRLHLHLTDDQGWRIEITAYPRLRDVGSWRTQSQHGPDDSTEFDGRPHGGCYTQDDLREIVAFARTRGVTVIPEIDLPGHSQAAIAAYPELSAAGVELPVWTSFGLNPHALDVSEEVFTFFTTVLEEVMDVFDAPMVCLGGDELDTTEWAQNPRIVERARSLGLASVEDLLAWFVARLAEVITARGRRTCVWDEVSPATLPADAVVLSWRGVSGAARAIRLGRDAVLCPSDTVYLDHRASDDPDEPAAVGPVHTVEDVYAFEPEAGVVGEALAGPGAGELLGVQANVWSEHLYTPRRVDFVTYPRLVAFSEVAWSRREDRDYADFAQRLVAHLQRLDAAGVEYRPLAGPKPWHRVPTWPASSRGHAEGGLAESG